MPRPLTREVRWLVKTFPKLRVGAANIPLKSWINRELIAQHEELKLHKKRHERRARKTLRIAATIPIKNNAPETNPESADLTL